LGILRVGEPDEQIAVAYGVLNKDTGVEATPDSLFQIGSNTKVWTATLLMQLVDEGKVDLDAPVVDYLPDLRLSDPDLTKQVTVRHLLTHTSGIDGDVFTDTGRGDDAVEKYVAALVNVAQNHPLGVTWSYCNSGFTLAGRVIEVLTGGTYDEALRTRIFAPLGLARTVTLPEEALLHRAACGHVSPPGADAPVRAPVWGIPRSAGPAGLISSTVRDVLAFARMHLTGGLAADGTRVLSADSAAAMASHQVDLPEKYTLGDSWGIGWARSDWGGTRLVGHGGNTIGQSAYFEMIPGQGFAVCLLTNGDNSHDLYEDLYTEIFAELAGVAKPKPVEPPEEPVRVSLGERAGTYERASQRFDVLDNADGPLLRITTTGELAALSPEPVRELPMVAVHEDMYLVRLPTMRTWIPATFYTIPTGERYLHLGVRATPKVA
jgi:CubicO group peptidase (beta-lactamase class C family)